MNWIAVRTLSSKRGLESESVEAKIGVPEEESPDTWRCPFMVMDSGTGDIEYAYGLDAFQALLMAIAGIRARIEHLHLEVSWRGSMPEDESDHGFPYYVPQSFGFRFSKRIETLIERELEIIARGQ